MIEFGLYPKLKRIGLDKIADIDNPEMLDDYLRTGKGAVLVSGHFGNLELVGVVTTLKKWPVDFLVGIQHNKKVNALMNYHRSLFGVGIIEIGLSAKEVFRVLRKGRWIAFLADQDARHHGTIVEFLGRPASTPKGAAAFALKCDCPIYVGMLVRKGLKHHTLHFRGPFTIEKSNDKENDIRQLTQLYTHAIAEFIYQYPDHYFWMHKRWKTTCPEDYK
jgi:KDO2-lipid IV(A) lauroyltransferase